MAITQQAKRDDVFTEQDRLNSIYQATRARTLLRFTIAAIHARLDAPAAGCAGSDPGPIRWHGLTRLACNELRCVRDRVMNTVDSPTCDWYTPLDLTEAVDNTMWAACGFVEYPITIVEAEYCEMLAIAVESIDQLISELEEFCVEPKPLYAA